MLIRRGDILLVNFNPVRENEANGIRPAIVVSNNIANQESTTIIVVTTTTNLERIYPFQLLLPVERTGLDADSKAQVEQIRAIGISRVVKRLSNVPDDLMTQLDSRIRFHLSVP